MKQINTTIIKYYDHNYTFNPSKQQIKIVVLRFSSITQVQINIESKKAYKSIL